MASRETTVLFRAEIDAQGAISGFKKVEGAVDGVTAKAKAATMEVGSVGGAMENGMRAMVGYAAATMGVAKALEAMGSSVKKAIDAREMEDLFKVSMGSMADSARSWAEELNKSLGLSQVALQRQLGIWNTMFSSMGLGRGKALELSEGLTKLGADMASFYHEDPSLMFEKLSAGMAGEIEPLKRLGVMVTQQTVQDYAWRTGMVATGQQLTQSQAILARYGTIMEATVKAQGNLALTLNSPANQLKVLNTRVGELQVSLGKFVTENPAFLGTIRTWAGWLTSWTASLVAARDAQLDLRAEMAKPLVGDTAEAERTLALQGRKQTEAATLKGQLAGQYAGLWQPYAAQAAQNIGTAGLAGAEANGEELSKWLKAQPAEVQAAAAAWERYRALQVDIAALGQRAAAAAKMAQQADKDRADEAKRAAEQAKSDRQSQLADLLTDAQARMDVTENAYSKLLSIGKQFGSSVRLDFDLGQASDLLDTWRKQAAQLVSLTREKERAATASKVQAAVDGKLDELQRSMVGAVAAQVDGWEKAADAKLRVAEVDKDSVGFYADSAKALEDYAAQVATLTNAPEGFVKWLRDVAAKLREAAQVQDDLNAGVRLQVYQDNEATKAVQDYTRAVEFANQADLDLLAALEARTKAVNDAWNGLNDSVREAGAAGITNGIVAAIKGDDFAKAWAEAWSSLANVAADKLQGVLKDLMSGKDGKTALQNAGLLTEGGQFNYKAAGAMGGALVTSYASARNMQGLAGVGGATQGGFTAAMATSNPYVIAAAAIINGIISYMSAAGARKYSYGLSTGPMGSTVGFGYGGPDTATMQDMTRQLQETVQNTAAAFRQVLLTMGRVGANPAFNAVWAGNTTDASAIFQTILKSEAPRVVFDAFKPILQSSLEGWGVSKDKASAELGTFATETFDTALAAFQKWVSEIKGFRDLVDSLSKDPVAEVTKGTMQTYRDSMAKTMDQVGLLAQGLADLTSDEQVARAEELGSAIEAGQAAAQSMLKEVVDAQAAIADTYLQFTRGRDLARAGKSGPMAQADLVEGWYTEAAGKVGTAKDPAELQKFLGAAVQYGQQLLDLADQLEAAADSFRTMGEDFGALMEDLSRGAAGEIAKLQQTTADAFRTDNTDAVSRIAGLREGLEGLGTQDQLARLGQIRDLTRTTYENNLTYLQEIVGVQGSIRSTFEGLYSSFAEGEAQKQGPAAQGQFYVQQLMDIQEKLRTAMDPKVIEGLVSQASGWASKLYGMGDAVQVDGGSAVAWLEPFLKGLQGTAETKLGGEVGAVQSANDKLASSVTGLGTLIDSQAELLSQSADRLRGLVDTSLADTVTTANDLLGSWSAELQGAIDALRTFAEEVLGILTGNGSDAAAGGATGTARKHIGDGTGANPPTGGGGNPPWTPPRTQVTPPDNAAVFGGLDAEITAIRNSATTATTAGTKEVDALAAAAAKAAQVLMSLAEATEAQGGVTTVQVDLALLDKTSQAIRAAQRNPRPSMGGVG